jgi:hypothetical protein
MEDILNWENISRFELILIKSEGNTWDIFGDTIWCSLRLSWSTKSRTITSITRIGHVSDRWGTRSPFSNNTGDWAFSTFNFSSISTLSRKSNRKFYWRSLCQNGSEWISTTSTFDRVSWSCSRKLEVNFCTSEFFPSKVLLSTNRNWRFNSQLNLLSFSINFEFLTSFTTTTRFHIKHKVDTKGQKVELTIKSPVPVCA